MLRANTPLGPTPKPTNARALSITRNSVLTILITLVPVFTHSQCRPLADASRLWQNPAIRWILVGEMHGSNETPAAFFDLVCDAAAHDRSITVALERPTSEQGLLEAMLTAADHKKAEAALLASPHWRHDAIPDGRASKAMLRLLNQLRKLRRTHTALHIAAFDAPYSGTAPGARDSALGQALLNLGQSRPLDTILVLTGNYHAMQAQMKGYDLAAMALPATARLSLEVTDRGGQSWLWTDQGCGPQENNVPDKDLARPRGIYLDPSLAPFGKVDGILALGTTLTPSSPAAGQPDNSLPCRVQYLSKHP